MPTGGKLTITAEHSQNRHVLLTVEDTGVGMSDKIKDRVFQPLFTTKSKGQGFGLAVCRRVIEAQGGTITFESQEGQGTKFIISLAVPQGAIQNPP
jgi:signal transduction histidine kinase